MGDLAHVHVLRLELLMQLVLAVVLGGAIGLERELKGKPAGLRTNIGHIRAIDPRMAASQPLFAARAHDNDRVHGSGFVHAEPI